MINPRKVAIGSDEERKLIAVAKILEAVSPNYYDYEVEVTYFDYGQDWAWTTIVCYDYFKHRSWQVLSPVEWKAIITASTVAELASITEKIRADEYFRDK